MFHFLNTWTSASAFVEQVMSDRLRNTEEVNANPSYLCVKRVNVFTEGTDLKSKTLLPFIVLKMAFIKSFTDFIFTLLQFKIALLQV